MGRLALLALLLVFALPGPARRLLWGKTVTASLADAEEEDWYALTLRPGRDQQVELVSSHGARLELYDATGERLLDAVQGRGSVRIFRRSARPRLVLVRVCKPRRPGSPYRIGWGPVVDDHGDVPRAATRLLVGARVRGDLEVAGDADAFLVRVRAGRSYVVDYGGVFSVELIGADGRTVLLRGRYGQLGPFVPTASGDVTVRLGPDEPGPYTVRVVERSRSATR